MTQCTQSMTSAKPGINTEDAVAEAGINDARERACVALDGRV